MSDHPPHDIHDVGAGRLTGYMCPNCHTTWPATVDRAAIEHEPCPTPPEPT